jgi:hypothetical protein
VLMFALSMFLLHYQLSSGVGEVRSAKRGAISVQFLPETNGLGGLKDR